MNDVDNLLRTSKKKINEIYKKWNLYDAVDATNLP